MNLIPWKTLSPPAQRLLLCHAFWGLGQALADAFVNIYILRLATSTGPVVNFQLWRGIAIPLGFYLACLLARKTSTAWSYRAGLFGLLGFFVAVLLLGKACLPYAAILGCFQGLALGMYWLGWAMLILDVTGDADRDKFAGTSLLGVGIAGMVGAPLGGWLLSAFGGIEGYFWLFLVTSLVYLTAIGISMDLRTSALPKGRLGMMWKVRHPPGSRAVLWSSFLAGIRDGVLVYFVAVLIYQTTGSEARLGSYSGWVAGLGLAGAFLATHVSKPGRRGFWMFLGAACVALGTAGLAWKVTLPTLLIHGTCVALLAPFFLIPYSSTIFKVVGQSKRLLRRRADYFTYREVYVASGRLVANLYLLVVAGGVASVSLRLLLALVGLIPLAMAFIIRSRVETSPVPA